MALTNCPQCGSLLSTEGTACPRCGCSVEGLHVVCPKCGGREIEVADRGWTILWGMLGAGRKINVCRQCGYGWRPSSLL
ncbi:MAG: hypothetical protein HFG09_02640 [Oscillibacter sp.]|nr:hypothetical protein [Oscillibacter sp.]